MNDLWSIEVISAIHNVVVVLPIKGITRENRFANELKVTQELDKLKEFGSQEKQVVARQVNKFIEQQFRLNVLGKWRGQLVNEVCRDS
jgi:hypothetical protein